MTIYCIGRNYRAHAQELGNEVPEIEPVVFLKSMATLRGLEPGPLAFANEQFHHEAELVIKIGEKVDFGAAGDWSKVAEVALGLDVTRRQVQNQLKSKGLPWTTAKSFAGAAVVGPFVQLGTFPNPNEIVFTLHVDDVLRQRGDLRSMIFPIPQLLTYLASLHDLHQGDLVFTGTPEGVGPLRQGDRFRLGFEGHGLSWDGVF